MSDIAIEADAFGMTVEQILGRIGDGVKNEIPDALEESLKVGRKAWKRNARAVLSASYSRGGWGRARKSAIRYRSGPHKGQVKSGWYGRTFKTGRYANSISYQMLQEGGETPEGEIGSPSMPGLAHLLEKGHGGPFPAGAHVHIADAADESFKDFERRAGQAIGRAIDGA